MRAVASLGAGRVAGVSIAQASFSTLLALTPYSLPRRGEIVLDSLALGFGMLLAVGAGLLSALAPAFRTAATTAAESLKAGQRTSLGGYARIRRSTVVAQLALALALLTCCGSARPESAPYRKRHRIRPTRTLLAELELPASEYRDRRRPRRLLARRRWSGASVLPGVEAVGVGRLGAAGGVGRNDLSGRRAERRVRRLYAGGYFHGARCAPAARPALRATTADACTSRIEEFPNQRTLRWAGMDIYMDAPLTDRRRRRLAGRIADARGGPEGVFARVAATVSRTRDADIVDPHRRPGGVDRRVRESSSKRWTPLLPVRFQTLRANYSAALARPRFRSR